MYYKIYYDIYLSVILYMVINYIIYIKLQSKLFHLELVIYNIRYCNDAL